VNSARTAKVTPERWQHIEQLYHDALGRPPAERTSWLAAACAGDEALRREVETLLASHGQAASFIETPPADIAAGMLAEKHSMYGRTLGHYRINALLGAGGMGEVYRARDLRLDRDVAVKILPEHLAQDVEALRRFEREAKAVAALSHPNILAIFDFDTESNVSYAVMELLEGETGGRDCRRRRRWAGCRARQRHHPSRPETGEHLFNHGWASQDSRFRHRACESCDQRRKRDASGHEHHD
jgi:hypothetical protein